MRLRASVFCVIGIVGCTTKETPAPSRPPPPASSAPAPIVVPVTSAPSVAISVEHPAFPPPKPTGPAACAESDWAKPANVEDVSWAKRVSDEMTKGITRKRLACLFGTPMETNGTYLRLTPHVPEFKEAMISGRWDDHPTETIEVTFAPASRPLLTSVEKATVTTKDTGRIHFDSPSQRIGYFAAPKDVESRIIVTLDKDDKTRVTQLHLDMSDLRGWTPKPIRCWDEFSVSVYPIKDRFEPGTWVFTATGPGMQQQTFTCKVPVDILDRGTCKPDKQGPSSAEMGAHSASITLHVDGQAKSVDVEAAHDGKAVKKASFTPRYSTVPTPTTPSGTCTNAHDIFAMRAP